MHKYRLLDADIHKLKKKKQNKKPAFASGQEDSVARGPEIQENFSLHTHLPFGFLYPVCLLASHTDSRGPSGLSQRHPLLIQFTPV